MGSTFPALVRSQGDFEDRIRLRMELLPERTAVIDPRRETLPDPRGFSGIVLTGSQTMVTDRKPWSESVAQWAAQAVAHEVPLLGICYGHQLLAHAMGGRIGPNPAGREFGTVEIMLDPEARDDPLLSAMPPRLLGHVCHSQTILELPPGATRLAHSQRERCHAFTIGRCAWGVQFHPEFDTQASRTYVEQFAPQLQSEGQSPEQVLDEVRDTPDAAALLRCFARLANGGQP